MDRWNIFRLKRQNVVEEYIVLKRKQRFIRDFLILFILIESISRTKKNMKAIKDEKLQNIIKRRHASTIKRLWKLRMKNFGQNINDIL